MDPASNVSLVGLGFLLFVSTSSLAPCALVCLLIHMVLFSYIPVFQKAFLTRGVPVEHIFLPFSVSR